MWSCTQTTAAGASSMRQFLDQNQARGMMHRSRLSRAPTLTDISGGDAVCVFMSVCEWVKNQFSCDTGIICKAIGHQGVHSVSHGCAPQTWSAWNGRPGSIRQPAHMDPGSSDPEEVVQPWADSMQTLPGSVVWNWKMLPGMSAALSHGSKKMFLKGKRVLMQSFKMH